MTKIYFVSGSIDSEVSEEQKAEKIQELKKKEKDLQDVLLKKIEELKKICMREAVSDHEGWYAEGAEWLRI